MLGGADNPNGELPSYITGADIGAGGTCRGAFSVAVACGSACMTVVAGASDDPEEKSSIRSPQPHRKR